MSVPVFYDCQASALEGFPIKIGWAYVGAPSDAIVSESHLVQPPPVWPIETWWDPDAERLHRITLRQLRAEGR
jgi:hypothetical protein